MFIYANGELYPRCICARGESEGYKYHCGYNFYLIFQQGTHLYARSKPEGMSLINNTYSYLAKAFKSIKLFCVPVVQQIDTKFTIGIMLAQGVAEDIILIKIIIFILAKLSKMNRCLIKSVDTSNSLKLKK